MTKEKGTARKKSFTGELEYRMTNDFMFKAVLQKNETALKGLLCALLDMEMKTIRAVRIMNPIEIGREITDKLMMLDLKLEMNDDCIMNIEMQVMNEGNWPVRSLAYLSRSFDQLEKGDSYQRVKETIHIGILDFTPEGFPEKLYMDYYFYNLDTAHKYSDKMSIRVLQLNQLGKEEDEAKMPAEAREDYYRRQRDMELFAVERGIEQGIQKGKEQMLVSTVDHAMQNLSLSLEQACEGLGVTVEEYRAAKKGQETAD